MKYVTKGDGSVERFSRLKIVLSLESVGLDRKRAIRIARSVRYHERITTEEIKLEVEGRLKRIDKGMAERYFESNDLRPKETLTGIWGKCLLNDEDMNDLDVKAGQVIEASDGRRNIKLRAYPIHDPYYKLGSVYMSEHDLSMLRTGLGSRLSVRKPASV